VVVAGGKALLRWKDLHQLAQFLRQHQSHRQEGHCYGSARHRTASEVAGRAKGVEHSNKQLLGHSTELKARLLRLQTIPGLDWYAAASFITHLRTIERFPKIGGVVSLAGLSVSQFGSVSSVSHKGHNDRHGRQPLRSLLYSAWVEGGRLRKGWSQL
jgi:hypothetical protein